MESMIKKHFTCVNESKEFKLWFEESESLKCPNDPSHAVSLIAEVGRKSEVKTEFPKGLERRKSYPDLVGNFQSISVSPAQGKKWVLHSGLAVWNINIDDPNHWVVQVKRTLDLGSGPTEYIVYQKWFETLAKTVVHTEGPRHALVNDLMTVDFNYLYEQQMPTVLYSATNDVYEIMPTKDAKHVDPNIGQEINGVFCFNPYTLSTTPPSWPTSPEIKEQLQIFGVRVNALEYDESVIIP